MSTTFKNKMREVMKQAWMLVKKYGFTMSEAMKQSWRVLKLRSDMKKGIVKFMYTKLDGTIRTAWGTLKSSLMPETSGTGRKPNETILTYFDTEKESYRSCKIVNLI